MSDTNQSPTPSRPKSQLSNGVVSTLASHGQDPQTRHDMTVSKKTPVHPLAQAIARAIESGKDVFITAIGAGAGQQAFKGVCVANGYLAPSGRQILVRPFMQDVEGKKQDPRTERGEMVTANHYQLICY